MEQKGIDMSSVTSGGPPSISRWNPTKEQISVLEGLYKQGIRTPSAEQIQQITNRLREYGHIEGKNVFYWFQNHKARQRQKQKQESMVHFNRFFNSSTPIMPHPLPPPCSNVICGPYSIPKPTVGFYPQYPKVLLPGGVRRYIGDRDTVVEKVKEGHNVEFESGNPVRNNTDTMDHETLQLFPLHPTGLVEERTPSPSVSTEACNLSFYAGTGTEESNGEQIFFDFFADRRSCERG